MVTLEEFKSEKPDIEQLRKQHPELSNLLIGKFAEKPADYRVYELPIVSWELLQNKPRNPTYGIVDVCKDITFKSSEYHTEVVTVLEGILEAEVNGFKNSYKKGQTLIAPPKSALKLDVKDAPVFYFCQYK